MEKDAERVSHWFNVDNGCALECLVIGKDDERRVYVVTTTPPQEFAWVHDRWPLITTQG